MKKTLIFLITALIVLFISFYGGNMVNAATSNFHYIVTTPGEDSSTQVRINWHSFVIGSYVEYTLASDTEFKNAINVLPSETLWSTEGMTNASKSSSFYTQERYVCRAEINNLTPRTNYIYRVRTDDEVSAVFHFTTSGLTNNWNFVVFTDFQHNSNSVSHKLIEKVRGLAGNPTLVLCSGDMIDTSAEEKEWKWFLDNDLFQNFTYASSPGDHEYWGDYANEHHLPLDGPNVYNVLFNNPKNGCEEALNTCFYFYYNNVLFVSLDMDDSNTVTSTKLTKEAAWFRKTIKELEGTFQYLIVLDHKSIYGSYTTDSRVSTTIRPAWFPVFDEAGVDIVFSGHDHMYSRTYKLYNNKVSKILTQGTYYVDMGTSGDKTREPDEGLTTDGLHELVLNLKQLGYACGAEVVVSEEKMDVIIYNSYGQIIDSFTTYPSRTATPIQYDNMDFGNIEDSVHIELTNSISQTGVLSFDDNEALRNLNHITLKSGEKVILDVAFSYGNVGYSYKLTGLDKTEYELELTLLNGSQKTIPLYLNYFDFSNFRVRESKGILKLLWNNKMSIISSRSFSLYADGELIKSFTTDEISTGQFVLDNKYLIGEHKFIIKVGDDSQDIEYTGVDALVMDKTLIELNVGDSTALSYDFVLDDLLDVYSSDSSIVTYDDGTVTAIKPGEAKIIFKIIDSDLQYECNVKVVKKGGCSSSAASIIILINLAYILTRRKKNF